MDLTTYRRDLAAGFEHRFVLVPAFDEPARAEVLRLRHQVYCQNLQWEPSHTDGMEHDAFDA